MDTQIQSPAQLSLVQDSYQLQGLDVLDICEQFGTPLYVYDTDKIRQQYEQMTTAFSTLPHKIKYPVKALSNLSILKYFKKLGAGLDTVSLAEANIGLKAGFSPSEIIFTPNCVSFEEIRKAVDLGLVINIDNISILEQFGHHFGDSVRSVFASIRIFLPEAIPRFQSAILIQSSGFPFTSVAMSSASSLPITCM